MFDLIKSKIFDKVSDAMGFFYVIKELGCLPEIIGREYEGEFEYKGEKISFKFKQRPMQIAQLNILMKELQDHNAREAKAHKRANKKH